LLLGCRQIWLNLSVYDYHFGLPQRIDPPPHQKKTIAKFQVPALYLLAMYNQKAKLKILKVLKPSDFLKRFSIAIIRPFY